MYRFMKPATCIVILKQNVPIARLLNNKDNKMKPVPNDKKNSLGKLPTDVRNKMGFMAKGGVAKKKKKKKKGKA